jgi:beta propeller repeat protein
VRRKVVILLITLSIILFGCSQRQPKVENDSKEDGISKDVYYSANGYWFKMSENYLAIAEEGIKIIDLDTKTLKDEIELPNGLAGGFDIYGTKLVWASYGSPKEDGKDYGYDETTNTDIFLYDIIDGTTKQITADLATQIAPRVWEDYIVWQDNRNDAVIDNNQEWDIYLYQISTGEEKLITTASGIHTDPSIHDNKIVWEDGRNFKGERALRWGDNVPENNTDIYLYDMETNEETAIATGELQECNPAVFGDYIVWEDRNNKSYNADLYLYDINKNKKITLTKDKYNQAEPKLYGQYIVWMDERNGISSNDVYVNGKAPNSDIFLFDIETKKEYLMTGKEPQVLPAISEHYIAYVTSRQINAEIQVIRYR